MNVIKTVFTWLRQKWIGTEISHRQASEILQKNADKLHETVVKLTTDLNTKQPKHHHK